MMKERVNHEAQAADSRQEFFWGCLPFVTTPTKVVDRMLELARVTTSDVVMDLGCGDGRILMAALEGFGARMAIGYEIREDLVRAAQELFDSRGLGDRVRLVKGDLLKANLSEASVIAIYLTGTGNERLRSKFEDEAKPGTRIVSHGFGVEGWRAAIVDGITGSRIFLYEVPGAFKEMKGISKGLRFWV
jgi:precorrin-6B methylase 2